MKVDRPVTLLGNGQDQIILSLTQSQPPASKSVLIKLELRWISPGEGEHANYLNHMEMPHCKTTCQIKASVHSLCATFLDGDQSDLLCSEPS